MTAVERTSLLVVDDEPEIREIVSLYLADLGCMVFEACDGEQALEVLAGQEIDVVISDLMMPRMSGMSLLETMRDRGIHSPFIFVTAYPSRDSTVEALRLGAFDYLEKPFNREHLQVLVKEALRVAKEQKSLSASALAPESADDEAGSATAEILKLRTLRYGEDPDSAQESTGVKPAELFVTEAKPQLLFAQASISNLKDPESRVFELGYLFRVMQALAKAAQAIDQTAIHLLADAGQRCYTALRVRPTSCTDDVVQTLNQVNETLRSMVESVGSDLAQASRAHDELVRSLEEITGRVEEGNRREMSA